MGDVVNFFSTIPSYLRTIIIASGFVLMWMIETAIPLFSNNTKKAGHVGVNLFFTLTTLIVNFIFAVLLVKASDFTTSYHFGVLYLLNLPLWLHAILGLMLLDLVGAYLVHLIEHSEMDVEVSYHSSYRSARECYNSIKASSG
jgi:hypothetical protein